MALLILALLQSIFLMSSLMLLLVWLIFFMVLIKLLPILGTISELTKMQLDNQKEIAEMQNETQKEIAGIQSATSRQNTKDQVYAQNEMLAYQQKESTARVASIMENTNLSKQQQVS